MAVFRRMPPGSAGWCCGSSCELGHQAFPDVDQVVGDHTEAYSQAYEDAVKKLGVDYISIPNRSTRSEHRRKLEKRPWFKNAQRRPTGCEGRISVLKRRHGLARCRYHGMQGMQRWVSQALLLRLLRLRGSGRFLDRVCGLNLFTLAFQAQFDEALPKLAVVHDSSSQPAEPYSCHAT